MRDVAGACAVAGTVLVAAGIAAGGPAVPLGVPAIVGGLGIRAMSGPSAMGARRMWSMCLLPAGLVALLLSPAPPAGPEYSSLLSYLATDPHGLRGGGATTADVATSVAWLFGQVAVATAMAGAIAAVAAGRAVGEGMPAVQALLARLAPKKAGKPADVAKPATDKPTTPSGEDAERRYRGMEAALAQSRVVEDDLRGQLARSEAKVAKVAELKRLMTTMLHPDLAGDDEAERAVRTRLFTTLWPKIREIA